MQNYKYYLFAKLNYGDYTEFFNFYAEHFGSPYLKKLQKFKFNIYYTALVEFRDEFLPNFNLHFVEEGDIYPTEYGEHAQLTEIVVPSEEILDVYERYMDKNSELQFKLFTFNPNNIKESLYIGFVIGDAAVLRKVVIVNGEFIPSTAYDYSKKEEVNDFN